jgi:hypothetical protein
MSVLPTIRTLRHTSAFFGTYASEPVHLWGKLYWLCRTLVEHYYFHVIRPENGKNPNRGVQQRPDEAD